MYLRILNMDTPVQLSAGKHEDFILTFMKIIGLHTGGIIGMI